MECMFSKPYVACLRFTAPFLNDFKWWPYLYVYTFLRLARPQDELLSSAGLIRSVRCEFSSESLNLTRRIVAQQKVLFVCILDWTIVVRLEPVLTSYLR